MSPPPIRKWSATAVGLSLLLVSSGCHRTPSPVAPLPPVHRTANPAGATAFPAINPVLARWTPTLEPFEGRRGLTTQRVALTFDGCYDPQGAALILKTLAQHHVHCTFFLAGYFLNHFPQSARAIADAGMELGNHSYNHPHFSKLTDTQIRSQLDRTEALIRKTCGRSAKPLFRYPYGDSDRHVQKIVAGRGYQAIQWTLDSLDSVGKPKSAQFVAKRVTGKIKPGSIVLMHVSCAESAKALPQIFAYLDKKGIQVVPVSEILLSKPNAPRRLAKTQIHPVSQPKKTG